MSGFAKLVHFPKSTDLLIESFLAVRNVGPLFTGQSALPMDIRIELIVRALEDALHQLLNTGRWVRWRCCDSGICIYMDGQIDYLPVDSIDHPGIRARRFETSPEFFQAYINSGRRTIGEIQDRINELQSLIVVFAGRMPDGVRVVSSERFDFALRREANQQ